MRCRENGMYYGGDPPAWTTMPDIAPEALYKAPEARSGKAGNVAASHGIYQPLQLPQMMSKLPL